jgi:hypothetical protein
MKKTFLLMIISAVTCMGYSQKELAVFNTAIPKEQTEKKECWKVCKEKISHVEQIKQALEYYKNTSHYSFSDRIKRSK